MLDDNNVLRQRDPAGALQLASAQHEQASFVAEIKNQDHDNREITRVVVAGMGGSALAGLFLKHWLASELTMPFEVVRTYNLPEYVDYNTLVIASSYSGNTSETLNALAEARARSAQVAIVTADGELLRAAEGEDIAHIKLPSGVPARMGMIYGLRALTSLLVHFEALGYERYAEIADQAQWLHDEAQKWTSDVTVDKNYAKQLALLAVGKTPVFYAGALMAPVAYKWKIDWNENAKNVAFWGELPEFNHNEFVGWTSHPVEKPFVVFDLVSRFEDPRILKRFEVSDRLLSGLRPKANEITLQGESPLAQMLWGSILADFTSIYVAILNGVDPTPIVLTEKLDRELSIQS